MAETHVIKNYYDLAKTSQRKIVLDVIEAGLNSIQPAIVMKNQFLVESNKLTIAGQIFDLDEYDRIFLIGFGKGSSGIAKIMESKLGERLTVGFDIDVVDETFAKVQYTKGTHPLPSQENIDYTRKVLEETQNLNPRDLVLVVVCGGGSVLFEAPAKVNLQTLTQTVSALLKSGATISEMNVIRKHLSQVKGGGLAKHLYPARVATLIFSDVPGNDLSVIASGPTVKDSITMQDVRSILKKYKILENVKLEDSDFIETAEDDKYFANVSNIIVASNMTALTAMMKRATDLGIAARIHSDRMQGDAKTVGQSLIEICRENEMLLVGGETTVHVKGSGKGGRNQSLVLAALEHLDGKIIIASFDSDGWDFYGFAGAIGDEQTKISSVKLNLNPKLFLDDDNSYEFFQRIGDGIDTGKLESNVSDIMMVYKY